MIEYLDHLVLTVQDIPTTCAFYNHVLGMEIITFGAGRTALRFGNQKINLHPAQDNPVGLVAERPTIGSADLCFIASRPLTEVIDHLKACDVTIIEGPIERNGATSPIMSVYFRDPDGNLIEVSEPKPLQPLTIGS